MEMDETIIEDGIDEEKERIASLEDAIERSKKERDEKIETLFLMVAQRLTRISEMWESALAYEQVAEKLRLFVGDDVSLEIEQLKTIKNHVVDRFKAISDQWEKENKIAESKWETWLDQWCYKNSSSICNINDIVEELLVLDICQNIWEALRRIPEFDAATKDGIDKMEKELAEAKRKSESK